MPKIGMSVLRISISKSGESFEKTLEGPPERIIALGFFSFIDFKSSSGDTTSE